MSKFFNSCLIKSLTNQSIAVTPISWGSFFFFFNSVHEQYLKQCITQCIVGYWICHDRVPVAPVVRAVKSLSCTQSGAYRTSVVGCGVGSVVHAAPPLVRALMRVPRLVVRAQAWFMGRNRKLSVATPLLQTLS